MAKGNSRDRQNSYEKEEEEEEEEEEEAHEKVEEEELHKALCAITLKVR